MQDKWATIDSDHLSSSNLPHVEGILYLCHSSGGGGGVAVKQSFHWQHGVLKNAVLVDLVAHGGRLWVKVFARKRQSLHRTWLGEGEPREKSVSQFAKVCSG